MTSPLLHPACQPVEPPVICKRPRKGEINNRRAENFKTLINMMRVNGITHAQAAEKLKVSRKVASNYLSELGRAGVTRFASEYPDGKRRATHRLSLNTDAVEDFVARLDMPRQASPTRIRVGDDPTRHFHLIFAAAMIHPEPVASPGPDPFALDPAFFAKRELAPIPPPVRPPVATTVQPTGFAALDVQFARVLPEPKKGARKIEQHTDKREPDWVGASHALAAIYGQFSGGAA